MRKKRGWRRAAALALSAVLLAGTALALYDAIWPQQSGTDVLTSKSLVVDAGNATQGYILARGKENKKRLKLRVTQTHTFGIRTFYRNGRMVIFL